VSDQTRRIPPPLSEPPPPPRRRATADELAEAEARGYQAAIDALRDKEATERYLLQGLGGEKELRLVRAIQRSSEWAADYLASRKDTQGE
jgi:hypothetical protein